MKDLYDKENLVVYLSLVEFREDIIIAKSNMIVLENQNKKFQRSLYYFSLRYQKNNPHATVFDLRPRKNIEILLPGFFKKILKNITSLQSHFTSESFLDITHTIEDSAKFYTKTSDEQARIKDNLDSYIDVTDKILVNFFCTN